MNHFKFLLCYLIAVMTSRSKACGCNKSLIPRCEKDTSSSSSSSSESICWEKVDICDKKRRNCSSSSNEVSCDVEKICIELKNNCNIKRRKDESRTRWRCPKKISERVYLNVMIKFMECVYEYKCIEPEYVRTLKHIYEKLGSDFNSLILFTTNALFNTSGFQFLSSKIGRKCDKYYSRGLLQIKGRRNYEILDEISEDDIWTRHPNKLAELRRRAIYVTCDFWSQNIWACSNQDYWSTLKLLNPEEVQDWCDNDREENRRLRNRLHLYNQLLDLFCRCF